MKVKRKRAAVPGGKSPGIPAEGIKRPDVFSVLVTEDVEVVVVGPDFEAAIAHSVPLVEDIFDFQGSARRRPKRESQRPLVSSVSCVAFDFESETHTMPHLRRSGLYPSSPKRGIDVEVLILHRQLAAHGEREILYTGKGSEADAALHQNFLRGSGNLVLGRGQRGDHGG